MTDLGREPKELLLLGLLEAHLRTKLKKPLMDVAEAMVDEVVASAMNELKVVVEHAYMHDRMGDLIKVIVERKQ